MKKKLIATSLVSVMALSAGVGAYAATKMTLIVNGNVSNVAPKVIDGTTYVPVRAAAELLGAKVSYDNKTKVVTITSEGGVQTSVSKVDDFIFTQLDVEEGLFGWDLTVDITNNGTKDYKGVNFTAIFYDANGKRLGTAWGTTGTLKKGETKVEDMYTTDDLTGWKTVKYQIDAKI